MSENKQAITKPIRQEREASFIGALIVFILCVGVIMGGIVGYGLDAQIPLVGAIIVMMVYGVLVLHIKFQELVQAMIRSLVDSLECILILLVIGMLIASWMACGTVPYIIYLGLGFLNPAWYLPFIVIMCAILSSVTGSSWTTVGTIGVAFIGISMGMGLPVPVTAGAIVCGAYFGDKCSPVSDIVVFNSGITKQNVYKHAKNVLWTTIPALLVTLVIFTVIGLRYSGMAIDQGSIDTIRNGLADYYHFSPVLWIPFVVLVLSIVLKVPALASLMFGCFAGIIVALIFQGDTFAELLHVMFYGYSADTGLAAIDTILNRGGMNSMTYIILIVITSMSLAGLFDRTKLLLTLVAKLTRLTRTRVGLIVTTMITGIITSFVCSDPYIAALVPVKAFEGEYEKQGLDITVLSRTVSDGGICFAPMVPWGSNGVFCATTMGIATTSYISYYFMGWLTPLFAILCAITGIGIKYAEGRKPNKKGEKAADNTVPTDTAN